VTDYTDQEALRIQPEIHSPEMPEPLKGRYQEGNGVVRLPCDDMKVADSVVCDDFISYCAEPDDKILFALQGAGDMFLIDTTCRDFLAPYTNWDNLQAQLDSDVTAFEAEHKEPGNANLLKRFPMKKVTFRNKFGVDQTEDDWFEFEYSIWWRMHSHEPRCFAGDHLTPATPVCQFYCWGQQCLLKNPPSPNTDNRLLAADMSEDKSVTRKRLLEQLAGPDIVAADYVDAKLPLKIPTRHLDSHKYVIPQN